MGSGSGEGGSRSWSVFDGIKAIPSTPEVLMAEIDSAIAASEYSLASTLLQASSTSSSSSSSSTKKSSESAETPPPQYDARLADESYKAGCAALAAGKIDEALHSLQISLSKCPPHKTSAVTKLQSLISLTSQQLHKPPG
ncbi:hypothetical protein BVC80_1825g20 [Macleaya cordata]|uniref:Tetratricopeptide repeat-containing domain n=1 Tax=Macleaya cordata TaxID=56857 RepID=A0A200QZ89_MACCD|nr:hypothetical protein BVC80_1825g20 [Macleaya cordata]